MIRIGLVMTAAVALTGCASLSVDVSVLDPDYVGQTSSAALQRQLAIALAAGDHSEADRTFAELIKARRELRLQCFKAYAAKGEELRPSLSNSATAIAALDADLATLSRSAESSSAQDAYDAAAATDRDRLLQADKAVNAKAYPEISSGTSGEPLPTALIAALAVRRTSYEQTIDTSLQLAARCPTAGLGGVAAVLNIPVPQPSLADKGAIMHLAQAQSGAVKQTITGNGALLSKQPEAYYVAQAGESNWKRRYNRAFGWGFGGGTDVVIKMNDQADFTVKGLVFDARSTADMVRKVGTSAIGLIASAYGAPVSVAPASDAKPASLSFATDKQMANAETASAVERARDAAYRSALLHLADSVTAEWSSLTNPKAAVKDAAHKRVTGGFNPAKSSWNTAQPASQ